MGPVDVTEVGIWNYQNLRARRAYDAHMYYMDAVAKKMQPKPKKKDFTEAKRKACEWPGCELKTRSKTGFCSMHQTTKARRRKCEVTGCKNKQASITNRCGNHREP